jgi:hypothetical protein
VGFVDLTLVGPSRGDHMSSAFSLWHGCVVANTGG